LSLFDGNFCHERRKALDNKETTAFLQNLVPHLYKLLRAERTEFFKTYSLTPTQYDVLFYLSRENLNLSALSDLVSLDSSTLVGIIDRLEKGLLIKKKVSPWDRRKNILSITDQGRILLSSIPYFISPGLRTVVEGLEPKEREELSRILNKIVENFEDKDFHPHQMEKFEELKPAGVL
jgi:DNA-binding MarR family transcriptional regulator